MINYFIKWWQYYFFILFPHKISTNESTYNNIIYGIKLVDKFEFSREYANKIENKLYFLAKKLYNADKLHKTVSYYEFVDFLITHFRNTQYHNYFIFQIQLLTFRVKRLVSASYKTTLVEVYCRILDLSPKNLSKEVIINQYKKLAKTHHPDMGGDPKRFQDINLAKTELLKLIS